ncbi:hypothetical protein [Desulfosporosinus meridiei]|uniref:Uncharacterized protein n=1 Tax=Desulfosporosinus meridiei (strain ATCC BAA-275 / DSM 13257 / KCTC 12902 / NCIMB 13706 / S10) TaxID=768704 RepID=J7J1T2_DESMD|nr:hypothetical protein [Desulfosporosinus meridiei]AFQ45273.1 hypothetical protein Desmer_3419 [Desulfosporosinus meridiei DSM 13257]
MSEQYQEAWRTYFAKNGYQPLLQMETDGPESFIIEEFCNDDGTVPEELSEIYLLCNESGVPCELLLVLDVSDGWKEDAIKALCREWDERILSFLNFGSLPGREQQSQYLLKYNVMQILLSDPVIARCAAAMSEEKSTNISRKLFVSIENGDVTESDLSMLPFYFDQLTQGTTASESESELEQILPRRDKVMCLYETYTTEKAFSEEEVAAVKEWLGNAKN